MKDLLTRHGTFLLALAAFLVGGLLVWTWLQPAAITPELTRAERRHLDRQATELRQAGQTHYATAQTLLHDPIPAGDSARRLAAFDSTIATW